MWYDDGTELDGRRKNDRDDSTLNFPKHGSASVPMTTWDTFSRSTEVHRGHRVVVHAGQRRRTLTSQAGTEQRRGRAHGNENTAAPWGHSHSRNSFFSLGSHINVLRSCEMRKCRWEDSSSRSAQGKNANND